MGSKESADFIQKEKKNISSEKTMEMLYNNKNIKEISMERKISEQTIESHILENYNKKTEEKINKHVGFTSNIYKDIKKVLEYINYKNIYIEPIVNYKEKREEVKQLYSAIYH